MKRPERINEIIKSGNDGSDNISNEDWMEIKEYIKQLESQIEPKVIK